MKWIARIEQWAWYVFLATCAWQTRLILWQEGPRFIEWRSASLFGSDVLMAVLVVCALIRSRQWLRRQLDAGEYIAGLLIASAILSLGMADSMPVGLLQLARLMQFILFFLYLRRYAWSRFPAVQSAWALVSGAVAQSALALVQYVLQHDIGLRWLGEPVITPAMRGVAVFLTHSGERILRAYGTMPHPNVLAAYLIVALAVLVWLWSRHASGASRWPYAVSSALMVLALGATYARTVVAVFALGMVVAVFFLRRQRAVLIACVWIACVGTLFGAVQWQRVYARLTIASTDEAVQLRVAYNDIAIGSGGRHTLNINWLGVGIGNFTVWWSRFDRTLPIFMYQPAHNVPLLVYTELGVIGAALWCALFAWAAWRAWHIYRDQPLVRVGVLTLLGMCLLIALMDHFFWTLQQGRILWWGVLALAAGKLNG